VGVTDNLQRKRNPGFGRGFLLRDSLHGEINADGRASER
jgi:hypothetical protein